MGGGWVELDLRFSPKRITLVSNHTDLSSTLLLFYILSTYRYSSLLPAFDPKSASLFRSIFRVRFQVDFQVDSQVDFQVSQGPSKGVPPRICQKVFKTDTFAIRIRIKRDPLHFQKFWTFSGSC